MTLLICTDIGQWCHGTFIALRGDAIGGIRAGGKVVPCFKMTFWVMAQAPSRQ